MARIRPAALTGIFVVALALGVSADRAWVAERGGSTVVFFDTTAALPPTPEGTVTVGSGPVDIASDQADSAGPLKLFVANSGSNTVSVIDALQKIVIGTLPGSGPFGAFAAPSGVVRAADLSFGPYIVVADQKVTTPAYGGPTGRSTIRFINPSTHAVVENFRDASGTARFNDVVWTSNRRLWVADDGDKGVAVVRLPSGPAPLSAPFFMGDTLIYNGPGEFADFVRDTAATPAFLLAPRRLATNGTTRVVVADGGSSKVTILDANYVPTGTLGEPGAILTHVTLATAGVGFCVDARVIGGFAYVSTANTAASGPNLHRIDLTTFATTSIVVGVGAATIGGLGATSDGLKLYAGDGGSGTSLYEIDVATFAVTPPTFTFGGTTPFAFYSSAPNSNPPSTTTGVPPGWGPGTNGGDSVCGLLGLEALLLLGFGLLRRRA